MECQVCKKERCIDTHFKGNAKLKICDDCMEMLGYDYEAMKAQICDVIYAEMREQIQMAVKDELPQLLEKLIKESNLEIVLEVV